MPLPPSTVDDARRQRHEANRPDQASNFDSSQKHYHTPPHGTAREPESLPAGMLARPRTPRKT
jgi:hypothetical protein